MNNHHARVETDSPERLARLLGFLRADPGNATLLADAARAAYDAHSFACCDELLARHEAIDPLPPSLLNLQGLSYMSQGQFHSALASFERATLLESNPVMQYNSAYAAAMLGRFDHALSLLDDPVIAAVPLAVALKVRSLYHLGNLKATIELAKLHVGDPEVEDEIAGLLATALLDSGDFAGAREYATLAHPTTDSLTVRGLLLLDDANNEDALSLFKEALEIRPDNHRADLGLGLALLAQENFGSAAKHMDAAAEAFVTHAGSWVAAGWAHLLDGKRELARARFEEASRVDRGFAEGPGSLAVVDFMEGKVAEAKHHATAALRLDRACLSAALARSLLSSAAGDQASANAIRHAALHRPLSSDGKTIAQILARHAATASPKR